MFLSRTHRHATRSLLLGLGLMVRPLFGQVVTPAGTWKGSWDSPNGSVYSAIVELTVTPDGSVDGSISWTLKDTRRDDLRPKIGQSGTEYIHGTYDARCRVLTVAGYKLDDPKQILGMDRYELILAPNGRGLAGVTANDMGEGDTWTGMLSLRH